MKFDACLFGLVGLASVAAASPIAQPQGPIDVPITEVVREGSEKRTVYQWSDEAPAHGPKHLRPVFEKRQDQTAKGEPIDSEGRGAPISGGTNHVLDLQNPENLGHEVTDAGVVPNLKWAFSDSHTRLLNGGWVREQVVTDLPSSTDISAAQQHLKKGAIRELHWHRVAEWGYVYAGAILISAVDEKGRNQVDRLEVGDIWYFPKGSAHTIEGLEDGNEYLLAFDDGNFDALGTTFMVDDWLAHTPKDIIAKNFGVDISVFNGTPTTDPYIIAPTNSVTPNKQVSSPYGHLSGNNSYVYHLSQMTVPEVGGGGGTLAVVDSNNFPISTTIAAAVVHLKPGGLREMHWHPNAEEWLFFVSGKARASVFMGNSVARSFDFRAGDTAVMPDNAGHYIENTDPNNELVWIELYKSDHVAEIPLTQWLALTPHDIVARTLNVSIDFVNQIKKEKQILIVPDQQ